MNADARERKGPYPRSSAFIRGSLSAGEELRRYLDRSSVARACLAVLGLAPMAVGDLARLFARRFSRGQVRRAVLELRRLAVVRACGRTWKKERQWVAIGNQATRVGQ